MLTQLCSPSTDHLTAAGSSAAAAVMSAAGVYNLDENCPLPDLAKLAADTMYTNFIELYNYLSAPNE